MSRSHWLTNLLSHVYSFNLLILTSAKNKIIFPILLIFRISDDNFVLQIEKHEATLHFNNVVTF